MYGSLGYIDSGKRAPHRQGGFLGMSNNPSRKEFAGARRQEDVVIAAPPPRRQEEGLSSSTTALLERRCVFLEEQHKRHTAEVADLRARLAQTAYAPETIRGTAVRKTLRVADLDDYENSERDFVEPGAALTLCYPMQSRVDGGAKQVWMRARTVDPVLATVEYKWVLLFEELAAEGDAEAPRDLVYVSDFA